MECGEAVVGLVTGEEDAQLVVRRLTSLTTGAGAGGGGCVGGIGGAAAGSGRGSAFPGFCC